MLLATAGCDSYMKKENDEKFRSGLLGQVFHDIVNQQISELPTSLSYISVSLQNKCQRLPCILHKNFWEFCHFEFSSQDIALNKT